MYNGNQLVVNFLEFLDDKESLTERSLDKENISTFLFPNSPYDDGKMRNILSDFLSVLETFLVHQYGKKNVVEEQILLARAYRKRGFKDAAAKSAQSALAGLPPVEQRSTADFLTAYALLEECHAQDSMQARGVSTQLQDMNEQLALYFMAQTLKNACICHSNRTLTGVDFSLPYLEAILEDMERGKYADVALLQFYRRAYLALTQPADTAHFFTLRDMMPTAASYVSPNELRDVLLLAINYCIRQMNTGHAAFAKEVFDLHRFGLENDLLRTEGYLDRFTFKNIVTLALRLGEHAWTVDFLEKRSVELHPEHREAYEQFCRARLYYAQQNGAAAVDILRGLAFDDVFLNLDARVLLAKIWLEQGELRLLKPFLTAFSQYLRRQTKIDYHRPNYQNIIAGLHKILGWQQAGRPTEQATALYAEIEALHPLAEKAWMLAWIGK
jgi:hypothetical protein